MLKLDNTDSESLWSIPSARGAPQLISLPKVVRSFEDFVRVDLAIGDNDPVYWATYRARYKISHEWATRFAVAMLTYYKSGVAARAADYEGKEFWDHLRSIFPTTPRGTERRHFRGTQGWEALNQMQLKSPDPDRFFELFPRTFMGVMDYCRDNLYQFGPYFVLKVCDYMDRCFDMPITDYTGLGKHLSKEPAKCAQLHYPELPVHLAFDRLCARAQATRALAGPAFDRLVGPAEVETVLCDWVHSKYKGNWFGADTLAKREQLKGYGPRAEIFASLMPDVRPQSDFPMELTYG
jgi:hypothetical protein